jgi:3-oxoadipate enol-lactonase
MSKGRDGDIHWIEQGHGPPLVLLHGLGGDAGFWDAELPVLSSAFRVIAVDLRGSGASPPSPMDPTMADLAEDVVELLDALDLGTAHVLGFSMGGNIAEALAARHPDRVGKLILAATFARMNPHARRFLDAVLGVYESGATARQIFELVCPWPFSLAFLSDPANAGAVSYPDDATEDQSMVAWRALYRAQQTFDGRDLLSDIQAETLVIVGERDALVSEDDARGLSEGIPSARLEILPGVGHLLNVEAHAPFLRSVLRHLGSDRRPV